MPLAIQTYAAAALRGRAPGDVIVAHTVLEERGGFGMQRLLEAGSVRPGAVVIGEATHGDICVGHRGRAEIEVIIHGLAGHASAPSRALNALALLPAVLEGCWELRGDQPSDPVLGAATVTPTSVEALPEMVDEVEDHDPEQNAARQQARARLAEVLDDMDVEKRAVLVMFEVESLSCDEIAKMLSVPVGTIYSRLHAARAQFEKLRKLHERRAEGGSR